MPSSWHQSEATINAWQLKIKEVKNKEKENKEEPY